MELEHGWAWSKWKGEGAGWSNPGRIPSISDHGACSEPSVASTGDSTAAGERSQGDLHLGTPQADATGLESSRDEEKPRCCCRSVFHLSLPETSQASHCAITGGF